MNGSRGWCCVLVAMLGCGGGGSVEPDAAGADPDATSADAAIDAMPTRISIHAVREGQGAAGVQVAFLDNADLPVLVTTTDAQGRASAELPAGGKVIASGGGQTAHVWLGARPGDDLQLILPGVAAPTTITVIVPTAPTTTTEYQVETSCGSGDSPTTTVVVSLAAGCTAGDVIVGADNNGVRGSAFAVTAQAFTPGATLNLSSQSYTAGHLVSLTATNIPAGLGTMRLSGGLVLGGLQSDYDIRSTLVPVNGEITLTATMDDLPIARRVTVYETYASRSMRQLVLLGPPTTGTIDVGASLMALISDPVYAGTTRTLSWTQGASGLLPDGIVAQFPLGDGLGGPVVTWVVSAPAGTAVQLPKLPSELAALATGDVLGTNTVVRAFRLPGGYDAARPHVFAVSAAYQLLATDGQLAVSLFAPAS